jgi:23S rRNA pseudouridine1911/1915/1917 synthase
LEAEGEKREIIVKESDAGKRLDHHLSSSGLNLSRSRLQKLIKDERIKVNDSPCRASHKLETGDRISVVVPPPAELDVRPEDIPLDIVFEDDDLIVVNKPAGIVVHPAEGNYSGTLVNALLFHCKNLSGIGGVLRPGIVHRLDKNTSGLIVVAKSDRAHQSLSDQMKDRSVLKKYIALVRGGVKFDTGVIDARIGRNPAYRKKMAVIKNQDRKSKEAVSHYRVLERFKGHSLLEIEIKTGRTHQIRVHLSHLGHPVVGDATYGKGRNEFDIRRQLLHAKVLGFTHPVTGEHVEFEADLPQDFADVLDSLRKNVPRNYS